jgi:hypothetical protein
VTGEISFDLVAGPDNEFEEGAYRLPGGEWRVFVVSKRPVAAPAVRADDLGQRYYRPLDRLPGGRDAGPGGGEAATWRGTGRFRLSGGARP